MRWKALDISSSTPLPPDACARLSQRGVLALPALADVGAVLSGCGLLKRGDTASFGKSSGAVSPRAVTVATGPHGGVVFSAEYRGTPMTVEVGPVAAKGRYTMARFHISTDSKKDVYLFQTFAQLESAGTIVDVRVMSLERSLVYVELGGNTEDFSGAVTKSVPKDAFPVFGALNDGVHSVKMLLPNMGAVVGVPVVKEAEVDSNVNDMIAKANLQGPDPGPFKPEQATLAMGGSSDTKQDEKPTTVTVAGNVTSVTNSDQLPTQADSVLATVVEQIKKYPSGRELTITGHTGDVVDDAHNQDLSEQRAKAVSECLKKLMSLSAWRESVSDKGESSPRVPNDTDEHRQINRHVETTPTSSKTVEFSALPSASETLSSATVPDPAGPVGKGPEGVDVRVGGGIMHMTINHVVRVGGYLTGKVVPTSSEVVSTPVAPFSLSRKMMEMRGLPGAFYVSSLTTPSGGLRYLGTNYAYSDGSRYPLADNFVYDFEPEVSQSFPAVWSDVGGDSVTIDMFAGEYLYTKERVVARLTDIPVVNA